MSKFKVGDRVRKRGGAKFSNGAITVTVAEKTNSCGDPYFVETDTWHPAGDLDLVSSSIEGPIRAVTRREIVPGVYGRVTVRSNVSKDSLNVGLTNIAGGKIGDTYMNAEDLREAAHLFNQFAEVLEENAAAA